MARRARAGARRVRRGSEFWREAVRRHAASGQTVREFCDDEGLSLSSFSRWRGKLAKEGPVMLPLEVVGDGPGLPVGSHFEVLLRSGHHLRVPANFDAAALARLVAALEGRSC
jgi:hypothetical protein